MPLPISQIQYVTYTRCLNEVKVIEQCCRKKQLFRVSFTDGRFVKLPFLQQHTEVYKTIFEKISFDELKELQSKISFINTVHANLKHYSLEERSSDDYAPLAAEFYNASLKTVTAWNAITREKWLYIDLPTNGQAELSPHFTDKTVAEIGNEKALTRYFELLEKYPKLRREEKLNDCNKGAYQIVYDLADISKIHAEVYQRLYSKAQSQGLSSLQADGLATNYSRPGVVHEDQFWLWIRDVVISPQKHKHTYNCIVWKCDLERIGEASALPIILEGNSKKIVVQLAFRHATNSWEFEMPRGASKANETSIDTAKREILEETGYETENLVCLGSVTPDSGVIASVVPIFFGEVTREGNAPRQD